MNRRTSIIYIVFLIALLIFTSFTFYKKILVSTYTVTVANAQYKGRHFDMNQNDYQINFVTKNKKVIKLYTDKVSTHHFSLGKHYKLTYIMNSPNVPFDHILKSYQVLD